jgi:hypothetical protein
MHGECSILCQHPVTISADLTHSDQRKRTTARSSLMVQPLSGPAILLPLLLSAIRLNDGMLFAASYMLSLAHMWCCASAPLSCFDHAISKLPLLYDSPMYNGTVYKTIILKSVSTVNKNKCYQISVYF